MSKHIIYQLLPRTFTNYNTKSTFNGDINENGCGKLNFITTKALRAIKSLGVTHIWYTGIIEHATTSDYSAYGIRSDNPAIVKGKAGSPYAIKDYYDIDPDLAEDVPARMKEWEALVKRTHRAGLQVVIDFVPNHVAREYYSDAKPENVEDLGASDHSEWAFSPLNNFYYLPGKTFRRGSYTEEPAKATGNDCFVSQPTDNDWYETIKLNYGVFYTGGGEKQFDPIPSTWVKMRDILLYWCTKGVDAFRCDMAEMVPVEFWGWAIPQVKEVFPYVEFIAEVYNPSLYRSYIHEGHFDYLYDKVGMYEYLRGMTSKSYCAEGITSQWQAVEDIRSHMLYFLENHDEQRIASGFFCGRGASAEPAMIVAATLGENPVLIYSGQEFGEKGMAAEGFSGIDGRSSIFDYCHIPTIQAWSNKGKFDGKHLSEDEKTLQLFYHTLLNLVLTHSALQNGKMFDLEYAQSASFNKRDHFAFMRGDGKETFLIVVNFGDKDSTIDVNIPTEAYQYLEQKDAFNSGIDLLHQTEITDLHHIHIPAWQGVIIQLA